MKKRIIFLTLSLFVSIFLFVSCGMSHEKRVELSCFDHIKYNNIDYYWLEEGFDIPEDFYPFSDKKAIIQIVDKNGKPYDTKTDEAIIYLNDPDTTFIYFNSAHFTNDLTKIAWWNDPNK